MNNVLTTADRLVSKLGPLNRVVERIVERVVPQQEALACSCPVICSYRVVTTGCPQECRVGRRLNTCGYASRDCFAGTTHQCYGPCYG